MVAGIRPRRVSVNPNFAVSAAATVSQTHISPRPPPKASPWMRPINGLGMVFSVCSIIANFRASRMRVSAIGGDLGLHPGKVAAGAE